MGLIIALLTLVLTLNSLLLILLVLIQLPKKEAGAGLAFGGAASDALFGAGSGTVLSRITKYGTGSFLGLCVVLAVLMNHEAKSGTRGIEREMLKRAAAAAAAQANPPAGASLTNLSGVLARELQTKAAAATVTNAETAPPATVPAAGTNAAPAK